MILEPAKPNLWFLLSLAWASPALNRKPPPFSRPLLTWSFSVPCLLHSQLSYLLPCRYTSLGVDTLSMIDSVALGKPSHRFSSGGSEDRKLFFREARLIANFLQVEVLSFDGKLHGPQACPLPKKRITNISPPSTV